MIHLDITPEQYAIIMFGLNIADTQSITRPIPYDRATIRAALAILRDAGPADARYPTLTH